MTKAELNIKQLKYSLNNNISVKTLITACANNGKSTIFIASASESINSVAASHQSSVYAVRPSARQRQVSS